jgi:hypothetical protein
MINLALMKSQNHADFKVNFHKNPKQRGKGKTTVVHDFGP